MNSINDGFFIFNCDQTLNQFYTAFSRVEIKTVAVDNFSERYCTTQFYLRVLLMSDLAVRNQQQLRAHGNILREPRYEDIENHQRTLFLNRIEFKSSGKSDKNDLLCMTQLRLDSVSLTHLLHVEMVHSGLDVSPYLTKVKNKNKNLIFRMKKATLDIHSCFMARFLWQGTQLLMYLIICVSK